MFHNKNAGDRTKWTYEPDLTRPAQTSDAGTFTPTMRLTWQVSPKHRFGVFWDAGSFKINRENYPGHGHRDQRARDRRHSAGQRQLTSAAGEVDGDDDEPAAARSGPRHVSTELEHARAARKRSRTDSCRRAVHRRVPRQRQHPGPDLSRHELECRLDVTQSRVRVRRPTSPADTASRAVTRVCCTSTCRIRSRTITTCSTGSTTACRIS